MSDNPDTREEIRRTIQSIFPSPDVASQVVDLVVNKRPKGWSRKSNAPYYKKVFATQIKHWIDRMIESGNSIVYRYKDFCTDDTGMSESSLYIMVNQSIRFLIDNMDENGKYERWYDSVRTTRKPGVGIIVNYLPGLSPLSQAQPEMAEPKETMPRWKQQMEEWLESDSTTPFIQEGLILSPEEIEALEVQFSQLSNVQASIKSSCIKIIKIN